MVPQADLPVRTDTVARVAARLAVALRQATPGTRVLPPDVLWAAAPRRDSAGDGPHGAALVRTGAPPIIRE